MVSLEELRNRHKQQMEKKSHQGDGKGNNNFHTLQQGDNMVRFLPGKNEPLDFYAEVAIHKYQDAEGKWSSYTCRRSENETCPMCDFYYDLWDKHKALKLPKVDGKSQKSQYGDMATQIKPKSRYYMRAVVRDLVGTEDESGNPADPVKYIAASPELFNIIMAAVVNPDLADDDDPDNTTILSLEKGNDFNIKITKKGEWNSFAESNVKIKKTRAGTPKQIAEWMDSPLDPKTLVKIGDYDEGKNIVANLQAQLSPVKTAKQIKKQEEEQEEENTDFGDIPF
jgi:hypothetical protein